MKRKQSAEEKLKCDIIANTKAIRQKFKKLKLSKANNEEVLNIAFKPIVEPLTKVMNDKKDILKEIKEIKKYEQKIIALDNEEINHEDPVPYIEGAQHVFSTLLGYKSAQSRAREFRVFAAKYVLLLLQPDENNKLDKVYGIRSYGTRWLLGKSSITISDDNIHIDVQEFKGSPGVFELLFMRNPYKDVYNEKDLITYKEILNTTNAHKQSYDEKHQVISNRGKKYKNIN
jgi:hypothetical protein